MADMAGDFYAAAIERLVKQAQGLGVEVPRSLATALCHVTASNGGARAWVALHPDDETVCCYGSMHDPLGCTCWTPEYDLEQAEPRILSCVDDLQAQPRMCGDCAFRKDSPERADEWSEAKLLELAGEGQPFWCHAGIRRPVRWVHPDGRTVAGDPADYDPPVLRGVPYQADGSPGLLCAGWVAQTVKLDREIEAEVAVGP